MDIVLCGVGGQGILSIAYVLDNAAMEAGLHFRQSEVHGMAQRGGAVQATVRISRTEVNGELVPSGSARLVLSVEPMESLRYLSMLAPDGTVVTDLTPHVNVADYPPMDRLCDALFRVPRMLALDGDRLARKAGTAKAQNMVMLGAASPLLPLEPALLEKHVAGLFGAKGGRVVEANLAAFRIGRAAGTLYGALVADGAPAAAAARLVARMDFDAAPVVDADVAAWRRLLARPDAGEIASKAFIAGVPFGHDAPSAAKLAEA